MSAWLGRCPYYEADRQQCWRIMCRVMHLAAEQVPEAGRVCQGEAVGVVARMCSCSVDMCVCVHARARACDCRGAQCGRCALACGCGVADDRCAHDTCFCGSLHWSLLLRLRGVCLQSLAAEKKAVTGACAECAVMHASVRMS
jgi:hypothetical protein